MVNKWPTFYCTCLAISSALHRKQTVLNIKPFILIFCPCTVSGELITLHATLDNELALIKLKMCLQRLRWSKGIWWLAPHFKGRAGQGRKRDGQPWSFWAHSRTFLLLAMKSADCYERIPRERTECRETASLDRLTREHALWLSTSLCQLTPETPRRTRRARGPVLETLWSGTSRTLAVGSPTPSSDAWRKCFGFWDIHWLRKRLLPSWIFLPSGGDVNRNNPPPTHSLLQQIFTGSLLYSLCDAGDTTVPKTN